MKKLLILSGYANCGKTTACHYLVDQLGYIKLSTSDLNHQLAEGFLRACFGVEYDSYNKENGVEYRIKPFDEPLPVWKSGKLENRQLLINVAEQAFVPVFGRDCFGYACARIVNAAMEGSFVYECFNFEELMGFMQNLQTNSVNIAVLQIRADFEQPGADNRELVNIEGETLIRIKNNGTIDELYRKLDYVNQIVNRNNG